MKFAPINPCASPWGIGMSGGDHRLRRDIAPYQKCSVGWSLANWFANRRFGFQPDVSGQPHCHAAGDDLRGGRSVHWKQQCRLPDRFV